MRGSARASRRQPVRRAVVALVVTALLAFAVVGTAADLAARRIARDDALAEAVRSTHSVGNVLLVPALPAVMAGDTTARARLDRAVRDRARAGTIVRVKVWSRDGVVLYSDEPAAIGLRFPLHEAVRLAIDDQRSTVEMSDLTEAEHLTETGTYDRLVEVYVPLTLDDGRQFALEVYSTDARVAAARALLVGQLVPFALLSLLVLLIAQLPVSIWLVRRVGRAQQERARLLRSALTASDRERRRIVRDLHDSVVQDLAGAGYALDSLVRSPALGSPEHAGGLLMRVSTVVHDTVGALRMLMVDIYPPDLSAAGLRSAIENLALPLRQAGVDVVVRSEPAIEPSSEISAALYRGARECLLNVAKHAHAGQVRVDLTGNDRAVRLVVEDDGTGLPSEPPVEGHLGLRLLGDAVTDLGGRMEVSNRPGGGTVVVMELPAADVGTLESLP